MIFSVLMILQYSQTQQILLSIPDDDFMDCISVDTGNDTKVRCWRPPDSRTCDSGWSAGPPETCRIGWGLSGSSEVESNSVLYASRTLVLNCGQLYELAQGQFRPCNSLVSLSLERLLHLRPCVG